MTKVLFISRSRVEDFPRLKYIPKVLSEQDCEVLIISPSTSNLGENINSAIIPDTVRLRPNKLYTLIDWLVYRFNVIRILRKNNLDEKHLIWFSSADSFLPLVFSKWLKFPRTIFQINELYDAYPFYRLLLHAALSKDSKVVVPEINRAILSQYWYNLNERPFVIPNKVVSAKTENNSDPILLHHINHLKEIKRQGYRIVIYQGMIEPRRDLSNLVRVLADSQEMLYIVFMGKDFGMMEKYNKINSNIYFLPFQESPKHLEITQLADIGILYYDHSELNQIYCAPNKIWEYSAFGIPFISNVLPGLDFATYQYRAGIQLNFSDGALLFKSIADILENYSEYSSNSRRLFNSVDTEELIKIIVSKAK